MISHDLDFHIVEVLLYCSSLALENTQTKAILNTCESN